MIKQTSCSQEEFCLLTEKEIAYLKQHPSRAKKLIRRAEQIDWLNTMFLAITIALFLMIFIVRVAVVNGDSMAPTLHQGDRLVIAPKLFSISVGDIVVAKRDKEEPIIKRVIATEGQTIELDSSSGVVRVDGKVLEEKYIAGPTYQGAGINAISFPVTVPKGSLFVMGDNRSNSLDSRYQEIGMIHTDHVFGEVIFRIYPINQIRFHL